MNSRQEEMGRYREVRPEMVLLCYRKTFDYLDFPVKIITGANTGIPFNYRFE